MWRTANSPTANSELEPSSTDDINRIVYGVQKLERARIIFHHFCTSVPSLGFYSQVAIKFRHRQEGNEEVGTPNKTIYEDRVVNNDGKKKKLKKKQQKTKKQTTTKTTTTENVWLIVYRVSSRLPCLFALHQPSKRIIKLINWHPQPAEPSKPTMYASTAQSISID